MDAVTDHSTTAATPPMQSFGLMRTGGKLLALRIDMLREVIACPEVLDPLPMTAPCLRGAVRLRGNIIPVLDLHGTLGDASSEPQRAAAAPVIVLMRCDGRLLGLLVDAVQGMADVPDARLHAISCVRPTGNDVVTHTFEVDDGIAMVLDAHRIAALPGVPMVDEPVAAPRDHGTGQREPMLLFRCGALPLGIAASCVEATVPRSKLRNSSLVDRLCRGVVDHHGHEVPVIDTLRALGFGAVADASESALVVLHFPKGLIALMLDEVCDVVSVGAGDVLPLAPLGLGAPHLYSGMLGPSTLPEMRDNHLVIDHVALQQDEALATFASLSRPKAHAAAQGAASAAASGGRAYLTYLVEVETASPLIQAVEILDYPQTGLVGLPNSRDATLGLFAHRGAAVPLVCLSSLLGRPMALDKATARVLIVECGARRIGFVVQALCSIETASWETPPASTNSGKARGVQPLVEIGMGEQRRTLPRLDLLQLARALLGDTQVAPPASVDAGVGADAADGGAAVVTTAPVDEPLLIAS